MSLLKVENLCKKFGEEQTLSNVCFSVDGGEILAIIGKSGSGKTTLLRCLNFLELPDEGKIFFKNELLFDAKVRYKTEEIRQKLRCFGYVFQAYHLFPQYNALNNVLLAPNLFAKQDAKSRAEYKAIKEQNRIDALALFERLDLKGKEGSAISELSGGQQQRVAIARMLMLKPKILCFDEPTSALDSSLTNEVMGLIESLRSEDTAILIVTHDEQIANRYRKYELFETKSAEK